MNDQNNPIPVMRPSGDMTNDPSEASKTPDKGGFSAMIRELKRLLDGLPADRQDAFRDEIEGGK